MDAKLLFEIRHLTKVFSAGSILGRKKILAVDDVSLSMPVKPEILSLVGESGSGKTTIARLILGFLKPTSGEIIYKGKSVTRMNKKERMNYLKEVQAVFQDPYGSFNPLRKVDYVLLTPIKKFKLTTSKEETYELITKSLEAVGLRSEEVLGKYPKELSGGQRQRIMLARAFLMRPQLLIADEPVSMLDASLRAGVLKIIFNLKNNLGVSFIYITHDLSTAHYISDKMAILYQGSIMEEGSAKRIVEEPMHPYTKLLIESIPMPDPKSRWQERLEIEKIELLSKSGISKSCKFSNRCSKKMDICTQKRPPMFDVNGVKVSCWLYQ